MPVSRDIRAVVFDLDDTLFPERDYAFSGFDAVGAWVEGHFPATRGQPSFAERAKSLFALGKRGDIFNETVAQYAVAWPADIIPRMVAVFREHRPRIALDAPVPALLRVLRERGFKTGVITDGWLEVQKRKIAALGLEALVDKVVCSDTWGREAWKPSPRAFREMESALGVRPEQCLYIGDNPAKDFSGACNAGWQAWRLRISGREHSEREVSPGSGAPGFVASDWAVLGEALTAEKAEKSI
jgi:putative hydrolase of the HAD superfamily